MQNIPPPKKKNVLDFQTWECEQLKDISNLLVVFFSVVSIFSVISKGSNH